MNFPNWFRITDRGFELPVAIFDMDGVLVDSEPLHLESTNQVLGTFGHALSAEQNERYLGMNEQRFWSELRERFGIDEDVDALIERRHHALVALLREHLPLADGIRDLLASLRASGIDMAVASSSEREAIEFILERGGIAEFFGVIASGDEVARSKPDPEIFLLAAERLGRPAEDCLVLEDSVNGVNAARAAGMRCLRVVTDTTRNIEFPEVDGVIETFVGLDLAEALNS